MRKWCRMFRCSYEQGELVKQNAYKECRTNKEIHVETKYVQNKILIFLYTFCVIFIDKLF